MAEPAAGDPITQAEPGMTVDGAAESLLKLPPEDDSDPGKGGDDPPKGDDPPADDPPEDDDPPKEDDPPEDDDPPKEDDPPQDGDDPPAEPDPDEALLTLLDDEGNEVKVTREEDRKSYMRQSDYTRKTQALADERREIIQQKEAVTSARERYIEGLKRVETVLGESAAAEPDWDKVRNENPEQLAELHAEWKIRQDRLEEVRKAREAEEEKTAGEERERHREHLRREQVKLREAFPEELKDVETGKQFIRDLHATGREYGWTQEEVETINDSRAVRVLHDAMKWRNLMAKKAAKAPKPDKGGKQITPGSRPAAAPGKKGKVNRQALGRLQSSGSVDDATEALLGLSDDA